MQPEKGFPIDARLFARRNELRERPGAQAHETAGQDLRDVGPERSFLPSAFFEAQTRCLETSCCAGISKTRKESQTFREHFELSCRTDFINGLTLPRL